MFRIARKIVPWLRRPAMWRLGLCLLLCLTAGTAFARTMPPPAAVAHQAHAPCCGDHQPSPAHHDCMHCNTSAPVNVALAVEQRVTAPWRPQRRIHNAIRQEKPPFGTGPTSPLRPPRIHII
ncbi:hypothetical protein NCH01_21710 [Neoasaia chiangmaiensis]|uniref:Uncharacterized protein n=1 Tax=Neoasaia chiangmaiensis TaxID=320497 RepID=A0A1U9KQQ7_9PROT|nr:hypothetical protein [Neoasaia chiangmaiensis]AQS88062.1 hypothetical protein A0U93_09020 [Neoasaia chiangmaiensis]GEN15740.1 hypothetical protein NCH01_21710 [Neoasaia chiangmaiensis]